jgi:uncharacterized membrane protein YfbV (UPF0208 family)
LLCTLVQIVLVEDAGHACRCVVGFSVAMLLGIQGVTWPGKAAQGNAD